MQKATKQQEKRPETGHEYEGIVSSANDILSKFMQEHGGRLSRKPWFDYTTYAEVDEALRLHRLRKKFCIIDSDQEEQRRRNTIAKFLAANNRRSLLRSAEWYSVQARYNPWLSRARTLIHSLFLEPVKPSYRYRKVGGDKRVSFVELVNTQPKASFDAWRRRFSLGMAKLLVGPGEQYLSYHGDVSEMAKIHHHKWTVTRKAEPYAKAAVWQDRAWRRAVIRAGIAEAGSCVRSLQGIGAKRRQQLYFELGWKHKTRIIAGSRLATVPKNNEIDRLINVEPLLNVCLQKWLGKLLEDVLLKAGITLEKGQSLHKKLIADPKWATIDFSAASDSYGPGLVKYLFPDFVYDSLMKVRSGIFEYEWLVKDEPCTFSESSQVYACMGNGTTFPILTLIVWAIGQASGEHTAFAYGDDLIINQKVAARVLHAFSFCGFTVNTEKSFIDHPVRESCGAFVFGRRYLRSFDIRACSNLADVITVCNKLYYYTRWSAWASTWYQLWASLVALVPSRYYGPPPCWDNSEELPVWCIHDTEAANGGHEGLRNWLKRNSRVQCLSVVGRVWDQARKEPGIPLFDRQLMRIDTGSEPTRHLRGEGEWKDQAFIVSIEGSLIGSVNELRLQRRREAELYSRRLKQYWLTFDYIQQWRRSKRLVTMARQSFLTNSRGEWGYFVDIFLSRCFDYME